MSESPGTTTVVLDTTVVINLANAGRLEMLGRIEGYAFVVPDQVVEEVSYPEQEKALTKAIQAGHVSRESSTDVAEVTLYAELEARMGKGEAACLAMAASRGWLLGSDDRGRAFRRLVRQRIDEKNVLDTPAIANLALERGAVTPEVVVQIQKLSEE